MIGIIIILVFPFRLSFYEDRQIDLFWVIFDYIVLVSYALKIYVEFNSPFQQPCGRMEYNRKKIVIRYMTFQVYIDVLTCIPINQNKINLMFLFQNTIRALIVVDIYRKYNLTSQTLLN
jgi:hypothetical protein